MAETPVILSSHPNTHQCKRTFDLKRETWADERVSALHSTELQQAAPGDTLNSQIIGLCSTDKRRDLNAQGEDFTGFFEAEKTARFHPLDYEKRYKSEDNYPMMDYIPSVCVCVDNERNP
ncbi:hypothetical protein V9T40_005576 [Parthenolecanium corni]|uniref:Uncharacterized protein n=1 Tax=Parthenolecanium corni TaxID=536013 RepID=A0AAN9TWX9_9HEMI